MGRLWNYFGAVMGRSEEDENLKLLGQFLMKISASYLRLSTRLPQERMEKADLARVAEILAMPIGTGADQAGWNEAYEAEQLLINVSTLAMARADLIKNLSDAERLGVSTAAVFRAEFEAIFAGPQAPRPDPAGQTPEAIAAAEAEAEAEAEAKVLAARALLVRVLDDVQWRFSQRYLLRSIANEYMFGMFWVFVALGLLFGIVLYIFPILPDLGFHGYPLALASGLLGAGFSILTSRQAIANIATIEGLRGATQFSTVLLRLCVGGGGAAILYFLFNSGFLGEGVFPDVSKIGFIPVGGHDLTAAQIEALQACAGIWAKSESGAGAITSGGVCDPDLTFVPNTALRLMIVWCAIAGFSEKLVPTILTSRADNPNAA
ncbi:MAG: hypothetical protein AAF360_09710 [Pseudomonadota bacterium]